MMKLLTHLLFVCFLSLGLTGCVGTVQETSVPSNIKEPSPDPTFAFAGLTAARPISHDKIELEFFPHGTNDVQYKLHVNNSSTAIDLDPQSLFVTLGGKFMYTVENLKTDNEYQFKLKAVNSKTGARSTQENEVFATTFDNKVAKFKGVSKVSLVPGKQNDSIRVDWIAPAMEGLFLAGPYDPAHYEVTLISEVGGAANLNNPTYGGTDKRVVLVPTPPLRASPLSNPSFTEINGLASNTKYFVQVRAINTLWQNFYEDTTVVTIPVSRETNTKFLSAKTDAGGSLFDFRQDNVILSNAPGSDAFDKINVYWQPGTGSFSNYRIFVRKYDGVGDASVDDKLTEATLVSMNGLGNYTNVATSDTSRTINGLDSYAWYQVKVALCKTPSCPVSTGDANVAIISDLKAIKVQPILAPFSGINSIEPPGQFSEKDVVKLRFDAPLMNAGFANELEFYCVNPADKTQMVKFDGNNVITGSPITICNGLYLSGTPPVLSSYNSQKVRGLITTGTNEYCFAATPAITGYGVDLRLTNPIVRCSYPEVLPPNISQFPGLKNPGTAGCMISGTSGKVEWTLPTGGIYSGFKVF